MRLLEIGMGCSMHHGVDGMHSLAVSHPHPCPLEVLNFSTAIGGIPGLSAVSRVWPSLLQLWRKYLTNTKVSYVENNAECAAKHKAEIESVAKGKIYVGEAVIPIICKVSLPRKFSHGQNRILWDYDELSLVGTCVWPRRPRGCECII